MFFLSRIFKLWCQYASLNYQCYTSLIYLFLVFTTVRLICFSLYSDMSNFNSMQTVYGGLYLNTVKPYFYYFPMNARETGACSVFTAHMPKFCPRNCSISSNVHAPQLSSISNCSDIVFFCFILSFKAIHIIVMDFVITAWHLFLEKHQPEVAQSNSCLPLSCCNRMWLFKVTDWLKELEQYP